MSIEVVKGSNYDVAYPIGQDEDSQKNYEVIKQWNFTKQRDVLPDVEDVEGLKAEEKILKRAVFLSTAKFDYKRQGTYLKHARNFRRTIRGNVVKYTEKIREILARHEDSTKLDERTVQEVRTTCITLQNLNLDEAAATVIVRREIPTDELSKDREGRNTRITEANETLETARKWFAGNHERSFHDKDHPPDEEARADYNRQVLAINDGAPPGDPSAHSTMIPKEGAESSKKEKNTGTRPKEVRSEEEAEQIGLIEAIRGADASVREIEMQEGINRTITALLEKVPALSVGPQHYSMSLDAMRESLIASQQTTGPNEKVPKFNGDYAAFPAYWQAFLSLVDQNPRLSTIVKLNRLKQSLEGEAKEVGDSYEFLESSYEPVKRAMVERFGDDKLAYNRLQIDLQNMDRVKNHDVKALRMLFNKGNQLIRKTNSLYPDLLKTPLPIISTIENKMSQDCSEAWEAEQAMRKRLGIKLREDDLCEYLINWLNDYVSGQEKTIAKKVLDGSIRKKNGN